MRSSASEPPGLERSEEAAVLLGRPVCFVDDDDYRCEILGAAVGRAGDIAYVESRSREVGNYEDVSIRIHLVNNDGGRRSAGIESYNPYFGCDVRFFEWIDATAILIYREKHSTYACRFGDIWPPRFVEIEDNWIIDGDMLAYAGYQETVGRRLSFPALEALDSIPASEAARIGLFPAAEEPDKQTPQPTRAGSMLSWLGRLFGRGR